MAVDTEQSAGGGPRGAGAALAGHLRVGLFPSFFYGRSTSAGELQGWGIEIAVLLAAGLCVEAEFVEYADPPEVVAALVAGDCDTAFIGITAERASLIDFSPPFVQADFTFLVKADSPVQQIADADREGVRIAVVRNHAMDNALKGKLARAQTVHANTPDAAFELWQRHEVDVLAGIRPGLVGYARKAPGARVLADRYGGNVLAMAVPKGRPDWLASVQAFVADAKASGLAQQVIERTGMHGLSIVD